MKSLAKQESAEQAVWPAGLLRVVRMLSVVVGLFPVFVPGDYAHLGGHVIGVDQEQAVLRVVGVAAPVHAADISWDGKRALQAGRSEKAVIAEGLDEFNASVAIRRSDPIGIVRGKLLRDESRGRQGKRLRGRGDFARDICLRDGTLLDGKYGRSCIAIQDIKEAGLVALNHDGNAFAVVLDGGEQRRGGGIVVPKIVMHELKSPDELPGLSAQGHDGVGPFVVTGTKAAVIIGAG